MKNPSYKILIVDDVLDWRNTLIGLLEDAGYAVRDAESADQALGLLDKYRFDLAVLDLRLDETNAEDEGGLELATEIRQKWSEVKVILITGFGTSERITKAIQPDRNRQKLVNDYLDKDDIDELIPRINKLLVG